MKVFGVFKIILFLIFIIFLVFGYCENIPVSQKTNFENKEIIFTDLQENYDGIIIPYREISVTSRVGALINNLKIKEGDYIDSNIVLCELDALKIKDELDKLEFDLNKMILENTKTQNFKTLTDYRIADSKVAMKKNEKAK
ncbi:hypothetical protein KA977_12515 [Candidatus Dependentiae bacterium]|nr:hypothetical protein [Candidatus Dependentiae bacterium]